MEYLNIRTAVSNISCYFNPVFVETCQMSEWTERFRS